MTSSELARQIFNRRNPNSWSNSMTRKQVNFFVDLLRRERNAPPTVQRQYSIYDNISPPLTVVVYPNGAGFVKVADHALTPDYTSASKWRLKTEAELACEGATRA